MGRVGALRRHSTNYRRDMKRFDPLTYRHPRTLEEAFPNPIERGYAVFGYRQLGLAVTRWAARAIGIVTLFVLLGYFSS